MKYIVEVLSRPGSGAATTIYGNRDAAEGALDNYAYHRAGQPVVVLYHGDDGVEALIAIGTSNSTYYIIGSSETNNYFTNIISANNIIVDPIDVTDLLSSTGPGYDFDGDYESVGTQRHFGWLGTKAAEWAVENRGSGWYTKSMTVQSMFDAILHGQKINREIVAPDVEVWISRSVNGPWEPDHIILDSADGDTQTIAIRLVCNNWAQISSDTNFNVTPNLPGDVETNLYDLFVTGQGEYIYSTDVSYTVSENEFILDASNDGGSDSDNAFVYWDHEPEPPTPPTQDRVITGTAGVEDTGDDFRITFSGTSTWISLNDDRWFEILDPSCNVTVSSSGSDSWSSSFYASTYSLEENKTYAYRAAATKDGETIYGDYVNFRLTRTPIANPTFTYSIGGGLGSLAGYVNDQLAPSGQSWENGSSWRVEPTPNEGYEYYKTEYFVGSLHYTTTANPPSGTLTDNVTAIVYFKPVQEPDPGEVTHNITYEVYLNNQLQSDPASFVNVSGVDWPIVEGYPVTIIVSTKSGYQFVRMKVKGRAQETDSTTMVIDHVNEDLVIEIYIIEATSFIVKLFKSPSNADATLMIDGEAITQKTFSAGETPNISCTTGSGWTFLGWYVNNTEYQHSQSFTYGEGRSIELVARFDNGSQPTEKIIVTVKPDNPSHGSVTNSKDNDEVASGTEISSTASPSTGYTFREWKKNNSVISGNPFSDTLTTPGIYTYIAYFDVIKFNVTYKIESQYADTIKFSDGTSEKTVQVNYGEHPSSVPTTLNDPQWSISYWTEEGSQTHVNPSQQVITSNKVYIAHLVEAPQNKIQYQFLGTKEEDLHDCWSSATAMSDERDGAYYWYGTNKSYAWKTYNDRNTTLFELHVPVIRSSNSTNFSDEGIKTVINLGTYTNSDVDVYIWNGSTWEKNSQGFSDTGYWTKIDDHQYYYNPSGSNGKDSIGIHVR